MKTQGISNVALALMVACATISCGSNRPLGPFQLGPLTAVRISDPASGAHAASLSSGRTMKFLLTLYDGRDSVTSGRGEWATRNAAVASNVGATFTAVGVGQTFAVARVDENGRVFVDSVPVTVIRP